MVINPIFQVEVESAATKKDQDPPEISSLKETPPRNLNFPTNLSHSGPSALGKGRLQHPVSQLILLKLLRVK